MHSWLALLAYLVPSWYLLYDIEIWSNITFMCKAFLSHFGESIKLLGLLTLELDSQVTEIFRPNSVSVLQ